MELHYCDLCDCALKEKDYYVLYCSSSARDTQAINNEADYYQAIDNVQKKVREICPACKELFDEVFRLRRQNLSAVNLDLLGMYNLAPYEDKKKKKK